MTKRYYKPNEFILLTEKDYEDERPTRILKVVEDLDLKLMAIEFAESSEDGFQSAPEFLNNEGLTFSEFLVNHCKVEDISFGVIPLGENFSLTKTIWE